MRRPLPRTHRPRRSPKGCWTTRRCSRRFATRRCGRTRASMRRWPRRSRPSARQRPRPLPPPTPQPAPRPVPAGDPLGFVDLGSLVMEEDGPRDTRMKGEQLETTGDEQRDFEDMLAQFKKGIDENVGHDDYQAHYDLGIAFKEMGLLDEAIAEFQKALRDPDGRLRTSEALGVAFFEKGQMAVAEAVLRRAVDTLEGGDDQKIGLIYWLGPRLRGAGAGPRGAAELRARDGGGHPVHGPARARGPSRHGAAAMNSQVASVTPRHRPGAHPAPAAAGAGRTASHRRGRFRPHRRRERAPVPDAGQDVPPHAHPAGRRGDRRARPAGRDAGRDDRADPPGHAGARRLGGSLGAAARHADDQRACSVTRSR